MSPSRATWTNRGDAPPRTPSLRQLRETECGVIALAIVLAHHGAWVPLPELRRRCQVSEQGVTALSLVQVARHYGLAIRAKRLPADHLRHIHAPVILFWENWHFVVLEGIQGDTAWVNDPARGHRKLTFAALEKGYSGIALIAQPGPEFRSIDRTHQPFRTAADLVRPGRRWLAMMGAAVLAESVLLPLVVQRAGDAVGEWRRGRVADWRPGALALSGMLVAGISRRWLTEAAHEAMAEPARRQLDNDLGDAPILDETGQSAMWSSGQELADYPATTAVRTVTAVIHMTVGVPLLVLVHRQFHPAGAVVAMGALASTVLMQQRAVRISGATVPADDLAHDSRGQRLVAWWPVLRPVVRLSPVIVVGVLTPSDSLAAVLVAMAASGFAFRLVDSSVQAFGMLYVLPESILQLEDIHRERGGSGHVA